MILVLLGGLVASADDLGEKLAEEVGEQKADGVGSSRAQASPQRARDITKFRRNEFHAISGVIVHGSRIVEYPGDSCC